MLCLLFVGSASAQTLTSMLDASGVPYKDAGDGAYLAVVTDNGTSTPMLVSQRTAVPGNTKDLVQVYSVATLVLEAPDGFRPPQAMLRAMANHNSNLNHGRLSTIDNSVYYTSDIFKSTATAETLTVQMLLAHMFTQEFKSAYAPYLEE